ncbi:hypothetical protein [Paenibacillus eucommiae]|uniref:Uncharacterized protein n=1 Tax=Paenibacillus eucommiae TaxID=1355755 RepID=A0ABS4IY62_9BACL|nr:hypothetical protein [Paenibacillus eucommiae]MBP1992528.1 hypothetical protein [Paenibacillus eucommiae]
MNWFKKFLKNKRYRQAIILKVLLGIFIATVGRVLFALLMGLL